MPSATPSTTPAAPCLVFLHGGYWQRNGREGFAALMDGVRAHRWSAALPGCTLAPEASVGEIVAEVHAALDWLADKVAGPVILSGWSAGGHLTAMALGHKQVHAGLAISWVHELGPLRDTSLNDALRLSDEDVTSRRRPRARRAGPARRGQPLHGAGQPAPARRGADQGGAGARVSAKRRARAAGAFSRPWARPAAARPTRP